MSNFCASVLDVGGGYSAYFFPALQYDMSNSTDILIFGWGETRCGGGWQLFQWQRLYAIKNIVHNSWNSIFTLQMCHKNSSWVLISQREKNVSRGIFNF